MNTTRTHKKFRTAVVGAMAASALLFLSAGSAHAFNPQPDPPGFPNPSSHVGLAQESESGHGDPRSEVGLAEESESGLGDPLILPPIHH